MYNYLQMIESPEDKLKFEHIYETYKKHMYYIAYGILHNVYDAEDAVHHAFVSIAKHIKTVRCENENELKAFVALIVERKAYDMIDKNKKYVPMDIDDTTYGYEIPLPGDSGLGDALAKLPARYREVILLRYAKGYTTKEIAKLFDIKQDSVQKLLKRAKEKLAEQLNEEPENV